MIAFYTSQIGHMRRGDSGQAIILFLTTVSAILVLLLSTVTVTYLGTEKVAFANAVDAIALSAATWEARGLNLIASLNDGILQCFRAVRWICVTWAALAVAACFGAGMPAFISYSQRAPGMIRAYWNCAKQLERWTHEVKSITPYLVLTETAGLSQKLKVTGTLVPFDPSGPHDGERTLELHLKQGPPLSLADAISPITRVPGQISKWKWAKKIANAINSVIGTAVGKVLGAEGGPIRMLEPEEDFPLRQKVRFVGEKTAPSLPVPYLARIGNHRFVMESFAEPYGGGTALMTWKSRLTVKPKTP